MATIEELKQERTRKLQILTDLGIDPYPARINLEGKIVSTKTAVELLSLTEKKEELVIIRGRIISKRGQGKILFVDLRDEWGKFQVVLKMDVLGREKMKLFEDTSDAGDFYAFSGKLFITQRGEKSLEVVEFQMLTKSILPMPTEYFGLENEEEIIRKRYLDFAMNPDKRELFYKKAKFWSVVRSFMNEHGFLEVETPTIETTTGGAEARPFKTYHNDFDMDVYMRISIGELWQKRLLAGGFEKIFEIGRAYRNEGSSPEHLQEFTNCEFYWAYADYKDGMRLVRDLYIRIAKEVFGTTIFEVRGHKFDLADEWKEIDYQEEILSRTGIDINSSSEAQMKQKLTELNVAWDGDNRERLTDTLWKYCRKQISGPAFLINHPLLVAPLSKPGKKTGTAQMFQPIIAGSEIGRGYSELNDPKLQRENFEQQRILLEEGDEEAMMPDWEFVEMLEHGMPPACGYGFGERLFSFLAGVSIREAQMFPLIKPKTEEK